MSDKLLVGDMSEWSGMFMDLIRQAEIIEQEPLGIIISRGPRAEETPRLWAYIWGPVPEPEDQPKPAAA